MPTILFNHQQPNPTQHNRIELSANAIHVSLPNSPNSLENIFKLTSRLVWDNDCYFFVIVLNYRKCFKICKLSVCLESIVNRVQFRFNPCQTSPVRHRSLAINSKCLNSSRKCPETFQTYSKCFELIADRYILLLSPLLLFSTATYSSQRRSNCSELNAIRFEVNQ